MYLRQGNTYELMVSVRDEDEPINIADISEVEFTFDKLKKYWNATDGTVRYDEADEAFYVPFTQQETFKFPDNFIKYQVRVKFADGAVTASDIGKINMKTSLSRAVL